MTKIIPRLVVAVPLGMPPAALFALESTTFALAGIDLDNHLVPFVPQLRAVFFLAIWAVLIYWAVWETDSIRRTISRSCWAFTVSSFLIPIASVTWGITSLPDPDQTIIPKSSTVLAVSVAGVVLGSVGLLLAKVISPKAAPEREVGRLVGDTRETVRRIGDARVAIALVLLVAGVVGLHVGSSEGSWSEKYTAIAMAGSHTCGVRTDGTAHCWGDNRAIPPEDEQFVSITPGFGFACGLREGGSVACWGRITFSRGLDVPADPSLWTGSGPFAEISTGSGYVCGEFPNGKVECSRDDKLGEASLLEGEPLTASRTSLIYPNLETSRGPFTQITAGWNHVCGLKMEGTVVCWGGNENGEASAPEGEVFIEISAGASHTCGLRPDGVGACWGSVDSPLGSEKLTTISSGYGYSCGIRVEGNVMCWGSNKYISGRPSVGASFVAVSSGAEHACGIKIDGSVACWGQEKLSQNYSFGSDYVEGDRFISISSGLRHNCGLLKNGTAKCWGGIWTNKLYR